MPQRGPSFIIDSIRRSFVDIDSPAVAAGFVPAGFEPAYLRDEEPTNVARIATVDPLYTRWDIEFGDGLPLPLEGVGAVNTNLSPGGLYRVVSSLLGSSYEALTTAPNAIVTSSNITGAVGNVDEAISAPDGNYIIPTDPDLPWFVQFSFPALSTIPKLGAHMAAFVVRMNRFGSIATYTPKVTCILYESGSQVAVLGTRAVTVPHSAEVPGQVFIFTFDLALLAATSGANLEVRITGSRADSSAYARLDSLCVLYEHDVVHPLDSGWLVSPLNDYALDQSRPRPDRSLSYFPTTGLDSAVGLHFMVRDDQVDHDPDPDNVSAVGVMEDLLVETAPDGYIDVGVLVAGELLEFNQSLVNNQPGGTLEHFGLGGGTTVGGQMIGADAYRQRSILVELWLSRDELLSLQDLYYRLGGNASVFFALEPDIPTRRQTFTSGWYVFEKMTEPTRLPNTAYDDGEDDPQRNMRFVVTIYLRQRL